MSPQWKCGRCGHAFSEPAETQVEVTQFHAAINSFVRFENPPSVQAVKGCAAGGSISSQLSMMDLDPAKLQPVLAGVELAAPCKTASVSSPGQGLGLSVAERNAVELHAMATATNLYQQMGWTIVDRSATRPFDLHAWKDGQQRFIEVKGTTGEGLNVILTHGEVLHAKQHVDQSVLVVVANIKLTQADSAWVASGGTIVCHQAPWVIDDGSLLPTQFRYELPVGQIRGWSANQTDNHPNG